MPKKKTEAAPEKVTAAMVIAALRKKYGESAVLTTEVPDAAGHRTKPRRLDAVAVGCWPSRGLFFHGIEVKVSRGDLLRELKNPAKAEAIACYCDAFYLACPKGIAKLDELPETWGLYEYTPRGIRVTRRASGAATRPLDREWVAALVRSVVQQHSDENVLAKREAAGHRAGWVEAEAFFTTNNAASAAAAAEAMQKLGEYERILAGWRYRQGGVTPEGMRRLVECIDGVRGRYGTLSSLRRSAERLAEDAATILEQAGVLAGLADGLFPDLRPKEADDAD